MDRKKQLDDFLKGIGEIGKEQPESVNAFMGLLKAGFTPGELELKTKELIGVAIGCYNRCELCIVYHVSEAYKAGATRGEILEAAMVSLTFGGGPSIAYIVTVLKESLDQLK